MTTAIATGKRLLDDAAAESGEALVLPGRLAFARSINTSGLTPYDTRVVILPDELSDKFEGTSLIRPDTLADKEKWAQTKGTLIAVGENAFADWGDVAKPEAGDRIVYGRYAGNTHEGTDGKKYTVANDEDILAGWSGK